MPSKVFSKGDSMSELPQKTSMGGGSGRIDRPMAAAGIGMGMGVVAGVAQKIKDAEKLAAYKRKPRMADAPPKIKLRKAYQE